MDNKVFSENLNNLISKNEKTQNEVANAIGVLPQTLNTWCTGKAYPRPDKVQLLADYFHIRKSELIEEQDFIKSTTENLNQFEQDVIRDLRKLDDTDKGKIRERIDVLLESDKYKDNGSS